MPSTRKDSKSKFSFLFPWFLGTQTSIVVEKYISLPTVVDGRKSTQFKYFFRRNHDFYLTGHAYIQVGIAGNGLVHSIRAYQTVG